LQEAGRPCREDCGGSALRVSSCCQRQKHTHVSNGKLEGINLDLDALDLEDAAAHFGAPGIHTLTMYLDEDGDALSTEEDVCEAGILDFSESSLATEVEGNVAHVGLDLAEGEADGVVLNILDVRIGRKLEVVVEHHLEDTAQPSQYKRKTVSVHLLRE
jgi:hypothetical protein